MIFEFLPVISSMSDMIFDPVWAQNVHRGNTHELLHVIQGKLTLTYEDGREYPAEPGDTLFTPAGTPHRDVFEVDEELEIFLIHFDWKHENEFSSQVNNNNIDSLSPTVKSQLKRLFDDLRFDVGSEDIDRTMASCRLMTILIMIYREIVIDGSDNHNDENDTDSGKRKRQWLTNEAKKYIEKHYREPIRLEDIAENLQVSPFYLSRIFSRESDFSLFEYLTDIRLDAAKQLLQEGRYIVADVAQMVGYDNSNYFSKVFKRRVGCTPTQYR